MESEASGHRGRLLALIAILGIVLYVVLDIVAQSLPPHYSPIRQAESDLGVGPYGGIMAANFVIRGIIAAAAASAAALAFPRRARPTLGLACIWLFAVCSALLALFPTDILDDAKLNPNPVATVHGELHLILAGIAFFAAPIGAILTSWALRRAPRLAAVRPVAMTVAILSAVALLLMPSFSRHHGGGLGERLFLLLTLLWLLVIAIGARAGSAREAAAPAA